MEPLSGFFKMGSSLLVVLFLMAFAAYGARRFLGSRMGLWRSASAVQVLSTTYLDSKRQISIISVGEEYLVLGITAHQISLLTRLDKPPAFLEKDVKSRGPGT